MDTNQDDRPRPLHYRRLYGNHTGEWLLVDGPRAWTAPETLGRLRLVGRLADVFLEAWTILEVRGHPPLATLARLLDIRKTALSNALHRQSVPTLGDDAWGCLARLVLDPGSVELPARVPMGRPWSSRVG